VEEWHIDAHGKKSRGGAQIFAKIGGGGAILFEQGYAILCFLLTRFWKFA